MNKVFNPLKKLFARPTQPNETAPRPRLDRFTLVSWGVTWVIVLAALGFALWQTLGARAATTPLPTTPPDAAQPSVALPAQILAGGTPAIDRSLQLKTNIPIERPSYAPIIYRVSRGDAMMAIADKFKVKSETILYVNKVLGDNPHSLQPGMELTIPPVDGLYYEWQEGDTIEDVAAKFEAEPEAILTFPGNNLDLTNPEIEPGTTIMIPGGVRKLRNWEADLVTMSRGAGTGTSEIGGNICGGGPVDNSLGWPADAHSLSGNGYGPGHLAIDITAPEGSNVYAAGGGVVTMAQGGYNYGYGNVVQIDHGNGWVTVYAHLSVYYVGVCQTVGQGTVIGLSGNTGNSFGAHLHFEIRIGGSNVNPYDYVQ
jgi:murein DD-endopeptidase MepM/ murein hydrolase activator NlpD